MDHADQVQRLNTHSMLIHVLLAVEAMFVAESERKINLILKLIENFRKHVSQ